MLKRTERESYSVEGVSYEEAVSFLEKSRLLLEEAGFKLEMIEFSKCFDYENDIQLDKYLILVRGERELISA